MASARFGCWALLLATTFACGGTSGAKHEAPVATEVPEAATAPSPVADASGAVGAVAIGPDAETLNVSDIVGKPAPSWDLATWFNGPPRKVEELRGSVVLVRWFMSSECPYCSATAPNLVKLHDAYGKNGLALVGMYHHKSKTPLVVDDVKKLVESQYKFSFPVAIDEDWRTLKRYWLTAHPEAWTSVSFLIDRRGTVRFVHTGGEYPAGSADDAQMRRWIELLLAEGA